MGTNFNEILIKIKKTLIPENAFENIICEMAAIVSRGRWVDKLFYFVMKEHFYSHQNDTVMHV